MNQHVSSPIRSGAVTVRLPDGSERSYPAGVTPLAVAESIGPGLAKASLAAKVDGRVVDLSHSIDADADVALLRFDDREGREVFWHSSAHVMAQAVTELFPGTKLAIGPPIEEGFYYDFDKPEPFTPDDLEKIEARVQEIVAEDAVFRREECSLGEARDLFKDKDETYKLEILEQIDDQGDRISLYRHSRFVDLCRGPHLPSTGRIKAFKLLGFAAAHWRDTTQNPSLQRLYGVSYPDKKLLKNFLQRREEALKRDHRKLGKALDLFSIKEDTGAGLVLWHPKGALVRRKVEDLWYQRHIDGGYEFVYSPHIARYDLWERSGHTDFYAENMFPPFDIENSPHQLKPMNCPFHMTVYRADVRSYRDLPMRYAEMGTVYRYEPSGVLHGLMRVRGFTQDDAHIFCTPEQIEDEIVRVVDFSLDLYRTFGFDDVRILVSTKPEKAIGEVADWELAEGALKRALDRRGVSYEVDEGAGAFYGPKIDLNVADAIGRQWQCGTVQFDFNLPERFDLTYVGADGGRHRPVVVHRALLGSIERFFGVLIEHYAGNFPVWLAPVPAVVLPVTDEVNEFARSVAAELRATGGRVEVDERSEKISLKIREAELQKVPYMLVVGAREASSRSVAVRRHGGEDLGSIPVGEFADRLRKELKPPRDNPVPGGN